MSAASRSLRQILGDFDRLSPISCATAVDRGVPIDRYYVDRWFASTRDAVRGRVLELGDGHYARQFGGGAITDIRTLSVDVDSPQFVEQFAALARDTGAGFDCLVMPQVLHAVFDVEEIIRLAHKLLEPGGVLLATLAGLGPLDSDGEDSRYWGFTSDSARHLFDAHFQPELVSVSAHGNVVAAIALMQGLASSELATHELNAVDADYEVVIGVCARRAG